MSAVITDVLTNIWDSVDNKLFDWGWMPIDFQSASKRYLFHLRQTYGAIPIVGSSKKFALATAFTPVELVSRPNGLRAHHRSMLSQQFRGRMLWHSHFERQNALATVAAGESLLIVGKPGAGKTTLTKQLAFSAATGAMKRTVSSQWTQFLSAEEQDVLAEQTSVAVLPVIVPLRQHIERGGLTLLDAICLELEAFVFPEQTMEFTETLLERGRLLIMFDGLDEVPTSDGRRIAIESDLQAFAARWPQVQMIVTSRIDTHLQLNALRPVELTDLRNEHVEQFIINWFHVDPTAADSCWAALSAPHQRSLLELGRVPLLLSLLCLTWERMGEFPIHLAELYRDATDLLLETWDASRQIVRDDSNSSLNLLEKRLILTQLAADAFDTDMFIYPRAYLERKLVNIARQLSSEPHVASGADLLRMFVTHHGMLVERSADCYSFSHLSFQQYYAAHAYATDRFDQLKPLLAREADPIWADVLRITVTLINDASELLDDYAQKVNTLAAQSYPIQRLLRWSAEAAAKANADTQYCPTAVRSWLLHRGLTISSNLVHPIALDLAAAQWLTQDILLNFKLDQMLYDLSESTYLWSFDYSLQKTIVLCQLLELDDLVTTLTALSEHAPTGETDLEGRVAFREQLRGSIGELHDLSIMKALHQVAQESYDELEQIDWLVEDCVELREYVEATLRLLACIYAANLQQSPMIANLIFEPAESVPQPRHTETGKRGWRRWFR